MKFKQTLTVCAVAAALATLGAAQAQTVRIGNQGDALSMDPHSLNETTQLSVVGNVYEPLVGRDENLKLTPRLATSWKHLYGNVDSKVRQSSRLVDKKDFNSDFTIEGTALDRDSLALQAGVDWGLSAQQTISLAYTSDIGSDSRNHGVMGQWQMGF